MRKILQTEDFVLGTFASNCSGGMTVTKLPERWAATWENNDQLGRLLDDAGIDFMLPIARWIGYGGETDFHGTVLETMTWATALLAKTNQITVFATIHVAATIRPWSPSNWRRSTRSVTAAPASTSSPAGTGRNMKRSALTCRANTSVATAMRRNGSI
jgi:hypothetical protein